MNEVPYLVTDYIEAIVKLFRFHNKPIPKNETLDAWAHKLINVSQDRNLLNNAFEGLQYFAGEINFFSIKNAIQSRKSYNKEDHKVCRYCNGSGFCIVNSRACACICDAGKNKPGYIKRVTELDLQVKDLQEERTLKPIENLIENI